MGIVRANSDREFKRVYNKALKALKQGIHPVLIPIGTLISNTLGSYFIRDQNLENIAVFKPRDEEPFAALNPKWPKFFQRILCFCCFGRACLIPNNGYLSETGASIVDDMLQNNLPIGFRYLFQKMIVLDYIIRNTDRHMDNLLIRHVPGKVIKLAAIDNGLAFPVKHPECVSRFRTFPFRWTNYRWAKEPWDVDLRMRLLTSINPAFLHDLCHELKILFRHRHINSRYLVFNQMRVVRGQVSERRKA
ncbi:unnamed protein product [Angiostrongylus costaricensis]|uniref:Phosphatidylinositol 4-kinase type 2 n=1 Tax=Angiostrongylus costaricensis TaxID=334426 RepID=A0A0R3PMI4_ANGCS|nr:unnamed protein product [Angiostrongylus costaricensis]